MVLRHIETGQHTVHIEVGHGAGSNSHRFALWGSDGKRLGWNSTTEGGAACRAGELVNIGLHSRTVFSTVRLWTYCN